MNLEFRQSNWPLSFISRSDLISGASPRFQVGVASGRIAFGFLISQEACSQLTMLTSRLPTVVRVVETFVGEPDCYRCRCLSQIDNWSDGPGRQADNSLTTRICRRAISIPIWKTACNLSCNLKRNHYQLYDLQIRWVLGKEATILYLLDTRLLLDESDFKRMTKEQLFTVFECLWCVFCFV